MEGSGVIRKRIRVAGLVQGVGLRPFVHNLARRMGLAGFVLNDRSGALIEVQGPEPGIAAFISALEADPPRLARIRSLEIQDIPPGGDQAFTIRQSAESGLEPVPILPDAATCDDCRRELLDPSDRRHLYPFINCTNCGPRFTITLGVPYDRAVTTMAGFEMCPECAREYADPGDRRFHAQPNACPECGPAARLLGPDGAEQAAGRLAVEQAVAALGRGMIVAVKGLGGYHLACDATDAGAVIRLRRRKARDRKPFAVMVRDLEAAAALVELEPGVGLLLTAPERPIVLAPKAEGCPAAEPVAPGLHTLGVILPYTPLHILLMRTGLVLVMTSGNLGGEPMIHGDDEALARLGPVADLVLTHDRRIHIRCDDSVARPFGDRAMILRRARGLAPAPLGLGFEVDRPTLAVGAELKNAFCLGRGREAFLGHHIGDLENLETLAALEQGIEHYARVLDIGFERVACDLHPGYLSTRFAGELAAAAGVPLIRVQHHHAHIASLLADLGGDRRIIGVALDGSGYGDDGTVWGGEFLVADMGGYERAGRLAPVPMPGGDRAVLEPWRMAAAWLTAALDRPLETVRKLLPIDPDRIAAVVRMLDGRVNCPETSSMGRLFDAVSCLVRFRESMGYEAQAAMELEAMACGFEADRAYGFEVGDRQGLLEADPGPMIRAVVQDLGLGTAPGLIAARFHAGVAEMTARMAAAVRDRTGIDVVGLSGGCFQNTRLLAETAPRLEALGFELLLHSRAPANDGGVALGQLAAACHGGE